MAQQEVKVSVAEAREIAHQNGIDVSVPTIISWLKENSLGYQIGGKGRWWIYKDTFTRFVRGERKVD